MARSKDRVASSVLILVSLFSVTNCDSKVSLANVIGRVSNRQSDVRTNLRSIRQLAIQSGIIVPRNESSSTITLAQDQANEDTWSNPNVNEAVHSQEDRKKGESSNSIIASGEISRGLDKQADEDYSSIEEQTEEEQEAVKEGYGGYNKKKKKKRLGWKKHAKKLIPIGLGIMFMKMLALHFILKQLALGTALSLFLSKKSLILSALIAMRLLFSQQHAGEKSSEGNKLEVVHIPIRKGSGFHKKFQLQQLKAKGKYPIKPTAASKPSTTTKKPHVFSHYSNEIKHPHQQMEDFGGKYVPLSYAPQQQSFFSSSFDTSTPSSYFSAFDASTSSSYFSSFDSSTPSSYLDGIENNVEGANSYYNYNSHDDQQQFFRRDGYDDGWSGWNPGADKEPFNGIYGGEAMNQNLSSYDMGMNGPSGSGSVNGSMGPVYNRGGYDPFQGGRSFSAGSGVLNLNRIMSLHQLRQRRKK
ncbi:uncharacterized protein LOC129740156 [Uranotaenia lowii]|uniref:uncharacterized protein LOC129740156 n=1 Tax=Uranotaenia lowii TaxID=190385 RepID=UPI00247AE49A|nr:uncharacterized protein LOC129740156 [Uranotaenia lowii]